jgi:hypothetical protein
MQHVPPKRFHQITRRHIPENVVDYFILLLPQSLETNFKLATSRTSHGPLSLPFMITPV